MPRENPRDIASNIELLRLARPYLTRRSKTNPLVREFKRRVRGCLREGMTPADAAKEFGLNSDNALKYNADLAEADFVREGTRWRLVDRKPDKTQQAA